MEEAPAVKERFELMHVCVGDLLGNLHRKHVGKVMKEVVGDVCLLAQHLSGDGLVVKGDYLDEVLKAGKGRELYLLRDEVSQMSVDEHSPDEDGPPFLRGRGGGVCTDLCATWLAAMEESLSRVEAMLGRLMVVSDLARSKVRLAAEKWNRRVAHEWDMSVAKAAGDVKAEK